MRVRGFWRHNVAVGMFAMAVFSGGLLASRAKDVAPGPEPAKFVPMAPAQAVLEQGRRGGGGGGAEAQGVDPIKFRYMGPAAAGRISAAVGIPGDTTTYYIGNASGGVWKSTDSGATFVPIFDGQDVQA